jgi:hypothetical protein
MQTPGAALLFFFFGANKEILTAGRKGKPG